MKLNSYAAYPAVQMAPGATRKLLAYQEGENGYTINYMEATPGVSAPPHSHPHLQVVYILSGKGDFRCGDEVSTVTSGDLIQIDSNVPHTFDTVYEDTRWLEFFTPNREDFKPE